MNPTPADISSFRLPAGAAPVACVDIGGTKVAVSVADSAGVRGKVAEPTAKVGDNDALARQIIRLVGESCAAAGVEVARIGAVGVSSCGPFVLREGLVELAAPNICGGMAGDLRLTRLLAGMGFRELSMPAALLPEVKQAILNTRIDALQPHVKKILRSYDPVVIRETLAAMESAGQTLH